MGKLICVFLLFAFLPNKGSAFSFENLFQNDSQKIKEAIALQHINLENFSSSLPKDRFKTIAEDPEDKISKDFEIEPYFQSSVHFWFNIYTIYTSQMVVLHDKSDLGIVYKAFNYEKIHQSDFDPQTQHALQNKFTLEKVRELKDALLKLSRNESVSSYYKTLIHDRVKKAGYVLPKTKKEKKNFYFKLANNLRVQTGQKDNIYQGLVNYSSFAPVVSKYFEAFDLPTELLAISFLESSFNPRAKSRVGATGVWQFMTFIGKHFMKVNRYRDDRLNPLISTVSALFLLKQNYQILDRWDLAVVAYNSGTKHLLRAKKKLELPELTLQDYLTKYDHPHVGFASKNFYSGFLALVYALAYEEHFFPKLEELQKKESDFQFQPKKVKAYVSKCSFNLRWFVNALKEGSPDIRFLNRHLKNLSHTYPRGTILYSDVKLTGRRYVKVPVEKMPYHFPKNWTRLIRGQKCSTR